MKSVLARFSDREKAQMLEHIVDEIVNHYNRLPDLPSGFRSRDEYNGNITRTTLLNNGFIES